MDKETVLVDKIANVKTKADTKQEVKPTRTAEYPQIREAVGRVIREYGETLKKLALLKFVVPAKPRSGEKPASLVIEKRITQTP